MKQFATIEVPQSALRRRPATAATVRPSADTGRPATVQADAQIASYLARALSARPPSAGWKREVARLVEQARSGRVSGYTEKG